MSEAGLQQTPAQADYQPLIALFDQCFGERYNTYLVAGGDEPVYLPADRKNPSSRVVFAHGFFSSALHEVAHWCLAGKERRRQVDYGYWYAADGRDAQQQQAFESVEVKPQALEWILSKSCQHRFKLSVDNLSGEATDPRPFKQAVHQQVLLYCQRGLPQRAEIFRRSLCAYYDSPDSLAAQVYLLEQL
jgi:hypothetical protein